MKSASLLLKSWFYDGIVYLSASAGCNVGFGGEMSSGKEMHRVPNSRIKVLTKDAKQMVNGPYYCPKCRKETLQILADLKNKQVYAACRCGLEWPLTYAPVFQPIDYYNKFRDAWKKQSYGIIKQK